MAKRKTIAEHAADVLRETGNPAVMYGDCGLLDQIVERANITKVGRYMDGHPINGWKKVLAGLERSDLFEKSLVSCGSSRVMRCFTLKETGDI